MRLENIMASMGKKDVPTVNVVLKTDVRGTLEALHVALTELSMDEVKFVSLALVLVRSLNLT
jgi:translation initiation factor IF-2